VIKSFADKATAALFAARRVRTLPSEIHRRAYAKLQALDAADTLDFLRVPPSNRLERLRGNREGQWSIRINDQWRICFRWHERDAYDVEVTDYH
jgi:proteic killer suppression protein